MNLVNFLFMTRLSMHLLNEVQNKKQLKSLRQCFAKTDCLLPSFLFFYFVYLFCFDPCDSQEYGKVLFLKPQFHNLLSEIPRYCNSKYPILHVFYFLIVVFFRFLFVDRRKATVKIVFRSCVKFKLVICITGSCLIRIF